MSIIIPKNSAPIIINRIDTLTKTKIRKKTELTVFLETVTMIAENTAIIIATRGHYFDDVALESALKTKAKYIGLVGSKRKTILIYKELLKKKISPETLKKVYAPIGLDIGAITPEEIAVSIMAQVVQFYMGGSGKALTMEEKRIEKFATAATI